MSRETRHGVAMRELALAASLLALTAGLEAQVHATRMPILKASGHPKEFGIQDETRTVISALSFMYDRNQAYVGQDLNTLSAVCVQCQGDYSETYSSLNLP